MNKVQLACVGQNSPQYNPKFLFLIEFFLFSCLNSQLLIKIYNMWFCLKVPFTV